MLDDSTKRRFSCRKTVLTTYSHSQMEQSSWREEIRFCEYPPCFRMTVPEERSTTMFFKESRTGFNQQTNKRILSKPRDDFWSTSRNQHVGPRCLQKDVVRRTSTTLDVLLENRKNDCWNVDGSQEPSGPWSSFTQFTILKGKASEWLHVVREAVNPNSSNIHATLFMVRCTVKFVGCSSTKGKEVLDTEKPKLGHARQLRGIYHIDRDDMEFKNTMKNARKKLEVPLESATACKIAHGHGETWCTQNNSRKIRMYH